MFAEGTVRGRTPTLIHTTLYISLADRQRVRARVTEIRGPRGTANTADNRFPSPAHRIVSAFRRRLVYADCAG